MDLRAPLIAGLPRGTRERTLPLLPSGPDGVCILPLRGTQLSAVPVKYETGTIRRAAPCGLDWVSGHCLSVGKYYRKILAEREGFEPSVRY